MGNPPRKDGAVVAGCEGVGRDESAESRRSTVVIVAPASRPIDDGEPGVDVKEWAEPVAEPPRMEAAASKDPGRAAAGSGRGGRRPGRAPPSPGTCMHNSGTPCSGRRSVDRPRTHRRDAPPGRTG